MGGFFLCFVYIIGNRFLRLNWECIRRNLFWLGMDGLFPLTNSIMNYTNNSYKWFLSASMFGYKGSMEVVMG